MCSIYYAQVIYDCISVACCVHLHLHATKTKGFRSEAVHTNLLYIISTGVQTKKTTDNQEKIINRAGVRAGVENPPKIGIVENMRKDSTILP